MTDEKDEKDLMLDLVEAEAELRQVAPARGAFGENASDYLNMYDVFSSVIQHAKALASDPNAFLSKDGKYNDKVINAYKGLMSTALKAMSELNRMRNSDRMTSFIVDSNTRDLVGQASVDIGLEIKKIMENIDNGASSDETIIALRKFLYQKLPQIFAKSAEASIEITKETYGLH